MAISINADDKTWIKDAIDAAFEAYRGSIAQTAVTTAVTAAATAVDAIS